MIENDVNYILLVESRLDFLINNAGLFYTDGQTEDGFDMSFGVNHLGKRLVDLNIPKLIFLFKKPDLFLK